LVVTFLEHAEKSSSGESTMTERFYRNYDEGFDATESQRLRYEEAIAEYQNHVGLVQDLILEATRYANHIADLVRSELDPDFRIEEGALLVRRVYEYFQIGLLKPEFRPEDFTNGQLQGSSDIRG
jgi:hypothetical protein